MVFKSDRQRKLVMSQYNKTTSKNTMVKGLRVKKFDTVYNRIEKKYPYPKAIVSYEGRNKVGIIKITTEGNPPIMKMHPKRVYEGIYDPIDDEWKLYNEDGEQVNFKDI